MQTVYRGILNLIRSAVTGQAMPLPEGFTLAEAAVPVRDGQVISLVYEGTVLCGVPEEPLLTGLRQAYRTQVLHSEKQVACLNAVCRAFDDAGIDYMPLKGSVLKQFYPRPELRAMGDADVLIRMEQYPVIGPIMEQLGFQEISETDHELVWVCPGLYLELHKRIMPADNTDLARYFGDGWKLAKLQQGTRYVMSDEDQMIYLFAHFAKHYRSGGIGCRHVVDLWIYRRSHPDLDEAYIRGELEKLRMLEFYDNILRMINVWFEGAEPDEKSEYLTLRFFKGTYFGTREEHMIAANARNTARFGSRMSKAARIWRGLFPDRLYMANKYPVLKKCGILLPILWVWRWITGIVLRRDNLRKMREDLQVPNAENTASYRQDLDYVGLKLDVEE